MIEPFPVFFPKPTTVYQTLSSRCHPDISIFNTPQIAKYFHSCTQLSKLGIQNYFQAAHHLPCHQFQSVTSSSERCLYLTFLLNPHDLCSSAGPFQLALITVIAPSRVFCGNTDNTNSSNSLLSAYHKADVLDQVLNMDQLLYCSVNLFCRLFQFSHFINEGNELQRT